MASSESESEDTRGSRCYLFSLQLSTAGFSERRVYFYRIGVKQRVGGLPGQGFYTCYKRTEAYVFLECLVSMGNLHSRVETRKELSLSPFLSPLVHHRWCSN